MESSLAEEQRRPARLRRLSGWGRNGFAAMAAVLAVVLIATAGLLAVVRPWQGRLPGPGASSGTLASAARCVSLTIDDVEAALRDTGSYRYTATGYLASAGMNLGGTPPPVRRDVTGTGSYLAPDRYIETWLPGDATDPSAGKLSMADTLRVGSDQWTRESAAAPLLWEKLQWPGSSDPLGGLIRLNWIDFERERAGWTSDPQSDMTTEGRCVLVGGPGMLDTGGTVTVWLAVDPSTALPAAMRVAIDNTVGSDARLDYVVEYGVRVEIQAPRPGEEASFSPSPAPDTSSPTTPVPAEPFDLRIYNRSEQSVVIMIIPVNAGTEFQRVDLGPLDCGSEMTVRPGVEVSFPPPWSVYLVHPGDQGTAGIDVYDDETGPQALVVDATGTTVGPARDQPVPSPRPCPAPAKSPSTAPSQSP